MGSGEWKGKLAQWGSSSADLQPCRPVTERQGPLHLLASLLLVGLDVQREAALQTASFCRRIQNIPRAVHYRSRQIHATLSSLNLSLDANQIEPWLNSTLPLSPARFAPAFAFLSFHHLKHKKQEKDWPMALAELCSGDDVGILLSPSPYLSFSCPSTSSAPKFFPPLPSSLFASATLSCSDSMAVPDQGSLPAPLKQSSSSYSSLSSPLTAAVNAIIQSVQAILHEKGRLRQGEADGASQVTSGTERLDHHDSGKAGGLSTAVDSSELSTSTSFMPASTSAIGQVREQAVLAGPSWVKEPSKETLSLAREIAESSTVCWSGFIRPVDKVWEVSSPFGPRWGRNHNGVDLAAPEGEPVLAADAGTVTYAGWEPSGFGNLVEITHEDGWRTLYAHVSEIFAWEGQPVQRGQCIALVGESGRATGPHLHWEIRKPNGAAVDPAAFVALSSKVTQLSG